MSEYKLTIALITMNRADQLTRALNSCVNAALPEKTQFVIVDNASSDDTPDAVNRFKRTCGYDCVFYREDTNVGVGPGRNRCFDLASGEYVYFLDDDAEIPQELSQSFFTAAIAYLDENPVVAALTTDVHDAVYGERFVRKAKRKTVSGKPCVYTFNEGTVFIRKKAFSSPLCMNIRYGSDGIAVSTRARDNGYENVMDPAFFINHYPPENKWQDHKDELAMCGIHNIYRTKKAMYPSVFFPFLIVVYQIRLFRNGIRRSAVSCIKERKSQINGSDTTRKIKCITVVKSLFRYGLTTF